MFSYNLLILLSGSVMRTEVLLSVSELCCFIKLYLNTLLL